MVFSSGIISAVALAFSVGVNAGPAARAIAPVKVPTSAVYNVSSEHKHLFGAHSNFGKRSCSSYITAAEGTATAMQSAYYNTGGYYQGGSGGGSAWTDVNAVEDLINLSLFNGLTTYDSVPEAVLSHYQSQLASSGAYDDALWGVLANFRQCDYAAYRGTSTSNCISRAIALYNVVVGAWDGTTCNGGVWWSSAKTYKNAITNELFLLTSAAGYLRTGQGALLSNAEIAWNWIQSSGMQNSAGLFNDGLTTACANNGQTAWTYNQAIITSGLGALYVATGSSNSALLTAAEKSIDATFSAMETSGILRESCDNASGTTTCDADQQIFKGVFMKHLSYYLTYVNDATKVSKYTGQINAQASGIVHYGTGSGYMVGSVWYAPDAGGSIRSPKTQTSGLAGLNAGAQYTTC
ncbi:glycoside hydrolase family 76 protein [Clavulina sp. PMI_390]|nr:glycoside hydrolase family 76 protein [Clavulina sp. PMI_390]